MGMDPAGRGKGATVASLVQVDSEGRAWVLGNYDIQLNTSPTGSVPVGHFHGSSFTHPLVPDGKMARAYSLQSKPQYGAREGKMKLMGIEEVKDLPCWLCRHTGVRNGKRQAGERIICDDCKHGRRSDVKDPEEHYQRLPALDALSQVLSRMILAAGHGIKPLRVVPLQDDFLLLQVGLWLRVCKLEPQALEYCLDEISMYTDDQLSWTHNCAVCEFRPSLNGGPTSPQCQSCYLATRSVRVGPSFTPLGTRFQAQCTDKAIASERFSGLLYSILVEFMPGSSWGNYDPLSDLVRWELPFETKLTVKHGEPQSWMRLGRILGQKLGGVPHTTCQGCDHFTNNKVGSQRDHSGETPCLHCCHASGIDYNNRHSLRKVAAAPETTTPVIDTDILLSMVPLLSEDETIELLLKLRPGMKLHLDKERDSWVAWLADDKNSKHSGAIHDRDRMTALRLLLQNVVHHTPGEAATALKQYRKPTVKKVVEPVVSDPIHTMGEEQTLALLLKLTPNGVVHTARDEKGWRIHMHYGPVGSRETSKWHVDTPDRKVRALHQLLRETASQANRMRPDDTVDLSGID